MSELIKGLLESRAADWERAKSLLTTAEAEKRELSADENTEFDKLMAAMSDKDAMTPDDAVAVRLLARSAKASGTVGYSGRVTAEDSTGAVTTTLIHAPGRGTVTTVRDTAGRVASYRIDPDGNGVADVYLKTAWGYWAMTPELTLGGGYAGSLGNIGYGYDGACTCYYTDNADVGFDPGDTTQLRLSYASGPFSMAVALEDSGFNNGYGNDNDYNNGQNLGVAGEIRVDPERHHILAR